MTNLHEQLPLTDVLEETDDVSYMLDEHFKVRTRMERMESLGLSPTNPKDIDCFQIFEQLGESACLRVHLSQNLINPDQLGTKIAAEYHQETDQLMRAAYACGSCSMKCAIEHVNDQWEASTILSIPPLDK